MHQDKDASADGQATLDEIRTVKRVTRDGDGYAVICPHCNRVIGIEGDDLSEIRGEQYQHRSCGGWLEVSHDAVFVKQLVHVG